MSSFVYYIPGQQQANHQVIAERGLAYALAGKHSYRGCERGPDGLKGCVVADPDRVPMAQFGYFKDRQTWRKIPGSDCYVGYDPDALPTPEDLLRDDHLVKSHPLELGDGRTWLLPIARSFAEVDGQITPYAALPVTSDLDAEGNWTSAKVHQRYADLWDTAERYLDHVMAGLAAQDRKPADPQREATVEVRFDFENLHAAAVQALAANYRVSAIECAVLGLLTVAHCNAILNVLIDLPGFDELLKKSSGAAAG